MSSRTYKISDIYKNYSLFQFKEEAMWFAEKSKKQPAFSMELTPVEYMRVGTEESTMYRVCLGLRLHGAFGDDRLFECDVSYVMLASIEGCDGAELELLVHTHCASTLFPMIRGEVLRLLSEAGLPRIQVQPIDFTTLYHSKKQEESASQEKQGDVV
jgi:protein-export chaperone SecB